MLDQHRADRRAGLRTATLASGYQGSPLAGLDQELGRLGPIATEHEIVLRRAVNEELGATAVSGSQIASSLPGARYDGVVGVWFGKAPGVDRASDAIRHANLVGTDPRGGVLALAGDDPASKSSTIPSASESLLAALRVPVLYPGSVQETLDLGRHAIACSRASGLWAALKVVTNVADAAGTAEVGVDRVTPVMPVLEWEGAPYVHRPSARLLPPISNEMERTLVEVRLATREALRAGQRAQPARAPGSRRPAGDHRGRRQRPRRARRARGPRARQRARAAGRDAVPARRGGGPRLRRRSRGDRRDRGEGPVPRAARARRALRRALDAAGAGRARRSRRAARAGSRCARPGRDRARDRRARARPRRRAGGPRAARGARPRRRPAGRRARLGANAVLLLRLPAQHEHGRAGGRRSSAPASAATRW